MMDESTWWLLSNHDKRPPTVHTTTRKIGSCLTQFVIISSSITAFPVERIKPWSSAIATATAPTFPVIVVVVIIIIIDILDICIHCEYWIFCIAIRRPSLARYLIHDKCHNHNGISVPYYCHNNNRYVSCGYISAMSISYFAYTINIEIVILMQLWLYQYEQ